MRIYYVNNHPRPEGPHEIHTVECVHLAGFSDRTFLGHFHDVQNAIIDARVIYPETECCNACIGDGQT